MKIVERFISQKCIGYTGKRTWIRSEVVFTDGTQGFVYDWQEETTSGLIQMGIAQEQKPYIERPEQVQP